MGERILQYYQMTKNAAPSSQLMRAVKFLKTKGTALDLGCGAGRDTRFLLSLGFQVTAVDKEPAVEKILSEIPDQRNLRCVISSFEEFNFGSYDLVNARYSLPFVPSDRFNEVFSKVK